ncbi:MAG: glaB [Eubacterium sp.]|nr:glaB [Eubacterium sp.]
MTTNIVNLNDFCRQDDLSTFREALKYCRENPHTTLIIPPGKYVIRDEAAVTLMNAAMNGEMGNNPQEHIFTHYFPYSRGLDFSGCKDITVEGYGAWILCDGWMEPVTLENCKDITIKGITIDYLRKPYSIGTVINEGEEFYDVSFDGKYPVNSNIPTPRIYAYSREKARFSDEGWDCDKKELVGSRTLRFYGEKPGVLKGERVCVWHSFHFRPAVFINEALNTSLFEVTIHSQPGMGIVGHRSENIHVKRLRIVPEAGEYMSTNTDATHFTSCKGELTFKDCQFEGHGDDAINVHNYYYNIKNNRGNTCEITVEDADAHAQVLDYPDVSDTLELVQIETLAPVREYKVVSVDNLKDQWKSKIVLDEALPDDSSQYYLINVTRLPELKFVGCHVRNHLARAVLIKTRNVLVEGCTFENSMGTAIHLAAEGGWHEGATSANVVIRNNRMLGCGHGNQGRIMGASGICVNIDAENTDTSDLHKNLLIENNIIQGENAAQGIYISSARDVTIRFNEISGCVEPVKVLNASNVIVTDNHIIYASL